LYNFTGNYVWVRATVVYTDGVVNSIQLNHWHTYLIFQVSAMYTYQFMVTNFSKDLKT
jgi:hypothetical protein